MYVWAKEIFCQLQFYVLGLWIYAILNVATSAGREVVELKMVNKIKEDKLKAGTIQPEQVDEIELPSEEKSVKWKTAIIAYSVATPLVLATPIMFAIFSDSMYEGEVCKFFSLAAEEHDYFACTQFYATNPQHYIDASGFRYDAFITALYAPVIFFFFEMCQNQLMMSWRHIWYQYIFTAVYALATGLYQISQGDTVIFPRTLDWLCESRAGAVEGCLVNECLLWFVYFIIVQTGCFALILVMHYLKAKFICKKNIKIEMQSTVELQSLTASRYLKVQ